VGGWVSGWVGGWVDRTGDGLADCMFLKQQHTVPKPGQSYPGSDQQGNWVKRGGGGQQAVSLSSSNSQHQGLGSYTQCQVSL
jgi:hypothetical protein